MAFAFSFTAVTAIIVEVDSFFSADLAEARTMFASAGFAFSSCFRAIGSSALMHDILT